MNDARRAELWRAIGETFVPAGDDGAVEPGWRRGIVDAMERAAAAQPVDARRDLDRLLALLDSPWLGLTWGGPHRPFTALDPAERERLLRRWAGSPVPLLRKAFLGLKQLSCFLAYAWAPAATNPHWSRLGYPGPPGDEPGADPPLRVVGFDEADDVDTVVVGSGAGGAVAAALRAEAGESVLVVEKGPLRPASEMHDLEAEAIAELYEAGGTWRNVRGDLTLLAGACVGGGTTVNWTGSFETPDWILEEWAASSGLPGLAGPSFRASLEAVRREASVTVEASEDNPQNAALRRGSLACGHERDVRRIPRNVLDCATDRCGYCGFGCRRGTKRDAVRTWLPRAVRAGAALLPDVSVTRIERGAQGRATAVALRSRNGRTRSVRCRRVVLAAGSLHTPAVLMRSGASHPWIGRPFYVHPVLGVTAFYRERIDPWHGPMMSTVNDRFVRIDGRHGFKIETPPLHPGLIGLGMPWRSARQHAESMSRAAHAATFIVLVRDRRGGRVRLDRDGRPRLHWRPGPHERSLLKRGLAEALRIHAAAGAGWAVLPHRAPTRVDLDDVRRDPARADRIVAGVRWRPHEVPLFSAHQMGSCRIGTRADRDPVDGCGRVRGFDGVHVADASLFPAASGVNPMITVQALAHWSTRRDLA